MSIETSENIPGRSVLLLLSIAPLTIKVLVLVLTTKSLLVIRASISLSGEEGTLIKSFCPKFIDST